MIFNFSFRKIATAIFLVNGFVAKSQFTNILIDDATFPNEPSIIINPKNTNQLVAGANFDNVYYSTDGGLTWINNLINSAYGIWGDPCLTVDTTGNFFYFHLSDSQFGGSFGGPGWLDRMVCQRSTNGGATWSTGTYTGLDVNDSTKDQDKPWSIVDHTGTSPYQNHMYLSWTEFDDYGSTTAGDSSRILFSKTTDEGATWSTAISISQFSGDCIDEDNTAEGAVPAVGPNGEVYVAWSNNQVIYFDRSLDGGQTWLPGDIAVSTQPVGWDYSIPGLFRCNGLPITACDISGSPYNGTIYVNWTDQRNGLSDTDVWLSKSTDNGNTWSLPARVNNDPPGKHNFMSWMTIDQATGTIYIVFYDRRNYNNTQTDVYLAYSTDGGATFTNVKISASPFIPTPGIFFGDYINITAHNGKVRPIWTRIASGISSVWTAIIDFPTGIDAANNFSLNTELQSFPNPFLHQTMISFNCKGEQELTLRLYDATGRKAAELFFEKKFTNGCHSFFLDNDKYKMSSGIYFMKLSNGNYAETKKIVVSQ
ncbi:MAG: T9SS type A sorting domain-containing protein [Bacteroidia bacterium]